MTQHVGFSVGAEGKFRFDNMRVDVPLSGGVALACEYDALGRVVGRTTFDTNGAVASQRYYVYDNDRIVQELDGNGVTVAEWVYGAYIDEPLAMFRDTDADGAIEPTETYYYLQDDLYNVIALTDVNGNPVERYTYDDYGVPTVWMKTGPGANDWAQSKDAFDIPVSAYGNPFMFTGRRWDETLALYDYRTRYYSPYLGRFLRMDTIGTWGDANNLGNPYAYVGNNPWSRLDPYGEWGFLQWLFDTPEAQAWDDFYGINKQRLEAYEARQQKIRDHVMATSMTAVQHEHAVYGVDIFGATGPNGELPDYGNTYGAFLYAKDKGLEVGGQSIRIGTLMVPTGSVAVLVDAGYVLVDSADGSLDPVNTGLTVLGIGIIGRGGRAARQELEIQEAAQAIAQSKARSSLEFVTEMAGQRAFAFDEFSQFISYWGRAPNNWVWHHIVEQSEIPRFGGKAINNLHNIVATSPKINRDLNKLYSQIRPDITGSDSLTVRMWLRTKTYEEVRSFGLRALENVSKGAWP